MQSSFSSVTLDSDFLGHMEKALQHNKFASVLFQANKLELSLEHYLKALSIADSIRLPYSNLLQNLGNLYAQKKEYQKAREYFLRVLEVSPYAQPSKYPDISKANEGEEETDSHGMVLYANHLNSLEAYVDAHTNLSFTLLGLGEPTAAVEYCKKSLKLKYNREAHINFGNALRQMGQREEAVRLVIDSIEADKHKEGQLEFKVRRLDVKAAPKHENKLPEETVNVITVKWGTKYDSEYVNKLFRGFKRHTSKQFNFICFTDNKAGLDPLIETRDIIEDWKGWWGKASIFSRTHGFQGLNFFIDLDMIITGSLDSLLEYKGSFCLLRTDELYCESLNKNGYNSSIILWRSDFFEPIYTILKECYEEVNKYIYR